MSKPIYKESKKQNLQLNQINEKGSNSLKIIISILFFLTPILGTTKINTFCSSCSQSSGACCGQTTSCALGKCDGYPYLQMRSQGRDIAREFAGIEQFINKNDKNLTYGTFSTTLEYDQSFNNKKFAQFIFGSDLINCCELYVQGSQVQDRNQKAWLADYFGLPEDFSSKVKFCPSIKNVVLDLNFYLGLDELTPGLFLIVDAPFTWTKWSLGQCEQLISTGTIGFQAGYMSKDPISAVNLQNSFLQVMQGGYNFGDLKVPMRYGKITNCDCKAYGFAQMDFSLGYNFVLKDNGHCGALIYASAPTGTRPCASKLFEPIIGNGKHWELGLGLSGSWKFYQSSKNEEKFAGLYFDAVAGHLFKTTQCRSFDFCSRPNSRYMLLEEIKSGDGNLTGQAPDYTASSYQYAKNLIPAINWTTFNIKTQINMQADISIKLAYTHDNYNFDLGYNLWARTGEKFANLATCACDTSKTYAIKGDTWLYGQYTDGVATATTVQMGQTQSFATIHGPNPCSTKPGQIDNGQLAYYTDNSHNQVTQVGLTSPQLYTSIQPNLVSKSMLATCNGPAGITHKIFGNLEYSWKEHKENIPFICLGAKVEFSQDRYNECCSCNNSCNCTNYNYSNNNLCNGNINTESNSNNSCNTCYTQDCDPSACAQIQNCGNCASFKEYKAPRVALSQWGLWIKGGVAFE